MSKVKLDESASMSASIYVYVYLPVTLKLQISAINIESWQLCHPLYRGSLEVYSVRPQKNKSGCMDRCWVPSRYWSYIHVHVHVHVASPSQWAGCHDKGYFWKHGEPGILTDVTAHVILLVESCVAS